MGNMQRVVFHSTIPSLLARNCYDWGPFEDFSKFSSKTFQILWTIRNSPNHVRKFSDDFRTLLKISEAFLKMLKIIKNIWKTLLNHFRQVFEGFRTLPKIPEDFPQILKNHKNIWSFQKISETFRTLLKIFPKF